MRKFKKIAVCALAAVLTIVPASVVATALDLPESTIDSQYGVNLAYGGPAERINATRTAASGSSGGTTPARAVDGVRSRAWHSDNRSAPWIYLDLGANEKFKKIVLTWESAAPAYSLQLSGDAVEWTTVASVKANDTQLQHTVTLDSFAEARFVRVQCAEGTSREVAVSEIEVYGPNALSVGAKLVESSMASYGEYLFDKNAASTWRSRADDDQYFIADLGAEKSFDNVKIRWGACFARRFKLYASDQKLSRDSDQWTLLYESDASLGETDDLFFDRTAARYIKLELIQRETNERYKENRSGNGGGYGSWPRLLPWEQQFEICSFDVFDWGNVQAVPVGNVMEFAPNAPAWSHMANITLNPEGLVLAPNGYPYEFKNASDDDIMNRNVEGFESYATYNPAVIVDDNGRFHMIYRSEVPDNFDHYNGGKAHHGHMSSLSYAYSDDGLHFTRGSDNPIKTPIRDEEKWGGTEDPRIFRVRDKNGKATYYITYTMYNDAVVREGMIKTQDFVTFTEVGNFAPRIGLKSGTYVVDPEGNAVLMDDPRPGKTGKVYYCIMKDGGVTGIGFTTNVEWIDPSDIVIVDDAGFGGGSVASITYGNESCVAVTNIYGEDDQDIVLMYGGTVLSDGSLKDRQPNSRNWFYALGLAKITKANPFELSKLKQDLVEPFMYPTDTNKIDSGLFVKCMFADTIVRHNDKWYFYYGAGDMYVGLATAEASFTANASDYEMKEGKLTASTLALNKKYGADKSATDVLYHYEVRDVNGELIARGSKDYSVHHFSETPEGKYFCGEKITVDIDASVLPSQYYVVSWLADKRGKVLNNLSSYAVLRGEVNLA